MNEWWKFLLAALAGGALGVFFLTSLWWTVRQLRESRQPALLFTTSFLLRLSVVLGGFLTLAMTGDWKLVVVALASFVLIRTLGVRFVTRGQPSRWNPPAAIQREPQPGSPPHGGEP